MGKIFTFDEIEQGQVPEASAFKVAKNETLSRLSSLACSREVVGAMVFGSVAKGTPSIRSDFDILVITEDGKALSPLQVAFGEVYKETKVAIEPIIIPRGFAEKGFHSLDGAFYLHLEQIPAGGNVVGTNPLDVLKPINTPLPKVHEQYLIQKLRRLREGVFAYSFLDGTRVLQRALETPVNTGRRTLQALFDIGTLSEPLGDDGKNSVISRFRTVFDGTQLVDGFDSLILRDQQYTNLLNDALSGKAGRTEYEEGVRLQTLESIPQAIGWVSEVSLTYIHLLEGARISAEGQPGYIKRERYS